MTIMSKDSQQAPDPRPDPLAQYPERYSEENQPGRPSPERIAELQAKSDATERRMQDAGLFGAGKGPPGIDQEVTRRGKQRAETIRGLKRDLPDLYAEEGQTETPEPAASAEPAPPSPRPFPKAQALEPARGNALIEQAIALAGPEFDAPHWRDLARQFYEHQEYEDGSDLDPSDASAVWLANGLKKYREQIQKPAPKNWRRGRRAGQVPG